MLTLSQALNKRGASGVPLPTIYASLAYKGAHICRGQVALIVASPSAGKTLLAYNLLAGMPEDISILAFVLDGGGVTTACAKFASIITGDEFATVKASMLANEERYPKALQERLPNIRVVTYATSLDDVQTQVNAHEQRFGLPPDLILIDVLGSIAGQYLDEWATLKAMTLELNAMADLEGCAIIAAHHTTDLLTTDPASRDKTLGKITQYPRLVLSVGFNPDTGEFKVAVVKGSEGKSDKEAKHPVTMYADPARMQLSEYPRPVAVPDIPPAAEGGGYDWRSEAYR